MAGAMSLLPPAGPEAVKKKRKKSKTHKKKKDGAATMSTSPKGTRPTSTLN
jgi:hypothetical protein